MKIGFISTYTNSLPPLTYGGESYYWGLVKSLSEMGHEIHLFATGGSEIPKNGKLHYIPSSPMGIINYSIEESMEKKYHDILMDMDIVHDCSLDHIAAERLRYLYGKKEIVNTINGSTYYMPRPPFNVVTGSKTWQEEAKKYGLNTEMIYWGIDTEFYTPEGEREDYYLWISRFHPDKGIEELLDLAEVLGFKLIIAGSTLFKDHREHYLKYKGKIESLPNIMYVELPNDSTHHIVKRELYRKAKAFIYPVRYNECFGLVIMEAMACGCPVISSDNGSMPELIEDKKSGFICKNKHDFCLSITKALDSYINNSKHHKGFDIYEKARERALEFDYRKSAKEYEKLYQRVIEGYSW